jgi:hypothetical protein
MVDGEQNGGKKIFRAVQFFPTTFGTTNQWKSQFAVCSHCLGLLRGENLWNQLRRALLTISANFISGRSLVRTLGAQHCKKRSGYLVCALKFRLNLGNRAFSPTQKP